MLNSISLSGVGFEYTDWVSTKYKQFKMCCWYQKTKKNVWNEPLHRWFLERCKHWSFIKFFSKKDFPFEILAIYYKGRHFQRELQNNWSDDVCVLEKKAYFCSTCDLPLHHTTLIGNPRNKTESSAGRCLQYLHRVRLFLKFNSRVLW